VSTPSLTEPTTAEVADVLDKAIAHMDRVGHFKGYLYDEEQADNGTPLKDCPVCAWGAINFAVHGEPRPAAEGTPAAYALAQAAGDAVRANLELKGLLSEWSDAKGRQKRQVTKAFRDTAARLREAK
jgi:hypothetical protein